MHAVTHTFHHLFASNLQSAITPQLLVPPRLLSQTRQPRHRLTRLPPTHRPRTRQLDPLRTIPPRRLLLHLFPRPLLPIHPLRTPHPRLRRPRDTSASTRSTSLLRARLQCFE